MNKERTSSRASLQSVVRQVCDDSLNVDRLVDLQQVTQQIDG
ncbi:MAG: hypothetical protein EZS28_019136, partial [Streblomastix strix]